MYGVCDPMEQATMYVVCNPMYGVGNSMQGVDDTVNHNLSSGFERLSLECEYFCQLSGLAVNFLLKKSFLFSVWLRSWKRELLKMCYLPAIVCCGFIFLHPAVSGPSTSCLVQTTFKTAFAKLMSLNVPQHLKCYFFISMTFESSCLYFFRLLPQL